MRTTTKAGTTKAKTLTVEEAEVQLTEARALFEELDTRLRSGQGSPNMTEWRESKEQIGFAEAALEGAKAAEARAQEERRKRDLEKTRTDALTKFTKGSDRVRAALDGAVAGIEALADVIEAYNIDEGELTAKLHMLRPPDDERLQRNEVNLVRNVLGQKIGPLSVVALVGAAVKRAIEPRIGETALYDWEQAWINALHPYAERERELRVLCHALNESTKGTRK